MKTKAKKTSSTKTKTVDSEHRALSAIFEQNTHQCKDVVSQLKQVKDELHQATENKDWERVVQLKDTISLLKEELTKTRNHNNELDYLMNTGKILFNYYNTFDDDYKPNTVDEFKQLNSKSILNFFTQQGKQQPQQTQKPVVASPPQTSAKRGGLYEQYMEIVDKNFVRQFPSEDNTLCSYCKCRTKQVMPGEGITLCSNCNTVEKTLLEVEKPSYKEPPTEVTYYAYKRINHFRCLS